jgi:hypothetical protein
VGLILVRTFGPYAKATKPALGQQGTKCSVQSMSALPLQADQISEKADIAGAMSGLPGAKAKSEARLMVSEKVLAAGLESGRLFLGASADSVVKRYRKKVKANVRCLSK